MRQLKSWKGLKKGDMVFFTHRKVKPKNPVTWVGVIVSRHRLTINMDTVRLDKIGRNKNTNFSNEWFDSSYPRWIAFRLNKQEREEMKLKITVASL